MRGKFKKFICIVKEDVAFYSHYQNGIKKSIGTILLRPGFQLCFLYRLGHFFHENKIRILPSIMEWFQYVLFSSRISSNAIIGKEFLIAHPIGIVIGQIICGNKITIWQNVTLGSHGNQSREAAYPKLDDNIQIYSNSVIVGGIKIGKNSVVGAMSFVNKDVPENSVVFGIPAKVVREVL